MTIENKEKILSKIHKMLKLADTDRGATLEEANTAVELIKKLLLKNGLSMADVMSEDEAREGDSSSEINEVEGAVFKCSKIPKWMTILISVVNKITDTKTIIRYYMETGKTYGTVKIIFIGFSEDVSIANELFHYLRNSVTKLSTKHQNEVSGKFQQWRSFAEGCSCKLMQRSLDLDVKWKPDTKINPWDINNFTYEEDDEDEQDNSEDDDEDEERCEGEDDTDERDTSKMDGEDTEFNEETYKKYELVVKSKHDKINEYINQIEAELLSLSTSSNLDYKSFDKGSISANNISLKVHNLVK